MGIKGITDKEASFPRLGELRKGAAKPKTGNKPGADLNDRFRFTSSIDEMEGIFANAFGTHPNRIKCYLPYRTTDENFPAWVEEWAAGGLKWRGDGETLVLWQKPDGTYSQEPKPQPPGGTGSGKLHLIIPALQRGGYVIALTTSVNDMIEITANLRAYEAIRGDLRGIPFVLSRVPRKISTPSGSGGSRARREKWLMHLEIDPDEAMAQIVGTARESTRISAPRPALARGSVDFETGEIVDGDDFDGYDYEEAEPPLVPDEFDTAHDDVPMEETARTAVDIAAALIAASAGNDGKPTDRMLSKMQIDLAKTCGSNSNAKTFLKSVFNVGSSTECTYGQVSALLKWIGSTAPDWIISPVAIAEAKIILDNPATM